VHVDEVAAAGPLVQVVDVLGDQQHLPRMFGLQPREREVRRVRAGLRADQVAATLIVEAVHQCGVGGVTFRAGNILHPVLLPDPVGRPEGADAGLRRDARAGEDDDAIVLTSHVGHFVRWSAGQRRA
jgi:hypothetical protein